MAQTSPRTIGFNLFSNSADPRKMGFKYDTLNIANINATNITATTGAITTLTSTTVNSGTINTDNINQYLTATVQIANARLNTSIGGNMYGAVNGFATLDNTGAVPLSQLPPGLTGANTKTAARVRTAPFPDLPAYTAAGAGIGKTITANANGSINLVGIDGVTTLAVNDRVFVDQGTFVAPVDRGIYTITALGNGGAPWVMTRATDFDESSEISYGTNFYVTEGNSSNGEGYSLSTPNPITIDVTALTFFKFTNVVPVYNINADGTGAMLMDVVPTYFSLYSMLFPGTPTNRAPSTLIFVYTITDNVALLDINWRLRNTTAGTTITSGTIVATTAYVNDTILTVSLIGTAWPSTPAVVELQAIYNPLGTTGTNIFEVRSLQLLG